MSGKGRLLQTAKSIQEYLGINEVVFRTFLKLGMPARIINGRWYAWTENLDDFCRALTRHPTREIPENCE